MVGLVLAGGLSVGLVLTAGGPADAAAKQPSYCTASLAVDHYTGRSDTAVHTLVGHVLAGRAARGRLLPQDDAGRAAALRPLHHRQGPLEPIQHQSLLHLHRRDQRTPGDHHPHPLTPTGTTPARPPRERYRSEASSAQVRSRSSLEP